METYLTIEELAQYLKVAEQTIRRWVLNREIPFCKIKKIIRFRITEIEKWVDNGGVNKKVPGNENLEGGLFVGNEDEEGTDGEGNEQLVMSNSGSEA